MGWGAVGTGAGSAEGLGMVLMLVELGIWVLPLRLYLAFIWAPIRVGVAPILEGVVCGYQYRSYIHVI